jgi:colicin import membrane protein
MKAGLTTSVVMHAALLGFGLISLSAPAPMNVADVEALPVDIVPVEELTQIQQGEKKAPVSEKPAPTPTKRPDTLPDAQKVGDNDVDTDNPITPDEKITPVKTAEAKAPSPKPVEKVKPEETPKPKDEPKPVPATEVAPVPAPKAEVKPEPVKQPDPKPEPVKQPEPKPVEKPTETVADAEKKPDAVSEAIAEAKDTPAEEATKLPDSAPAPQARPKPAEAQTAKAPERKEAEKPVKEASSKAQSEETGSIEDDIAAVLNKTKAKGGGAKRSTKEAALGGKNNTGAKLSQGEMDALRGQLIQCWNPPVGMEDGGGLRASIRFNVDTSGKMEGQPELVSSSGNTQFDESALRAIRKCDAQGLNLPVEKAEIWSVINVNFDPSEMF